MAKLMSPSLLTGRYTDHRAEHGVAVATSLGQPKWPLPYDLAHEIRDLMPVGLFGRDMPWAEFEQGYRARLDRVGVDQLRAHFQRIAAQHPGQPLVLLCWENVHAGQECHRRVAAAWWQAKTGEAVPEAQVQPARNAHPLVSGQLSLGRSED